MKQELFKKWQDAIGHPKNYTFKHSLRLVRNIDHPDFDGELLSSNLWTRRISESSEVIP